MGRRLTVAFVSCALALVPVPALAQSEDGDAPTGSLAAQLLAVADESLGEDATTAVLRAYDRGYELLQIVEALFDGRLAADGTITDEDGAPVEPFRVGANLIEGDGATTGTVASRFGPNGAEEIAITALETGIAKATKRIDEQVDLGARAERAGASGEDLFTMLTAIALIAKGYSPEEVIVDGFASNGIRIRGPGFDPVIVNDAGKVLSPGGVEESADAEEQRESIDQLADEIVDLVGGVDPRVAAEEPIKKEFTVELDITVGVDDDAPFTITATGKIGHPKSSSDQLDGWVLGTAAGHVDGDGTCSIGDFIDESVGWTVTGPVDLGLAGPIDGNAVSLKAGVVKSILDVSVENEDTICGDLVLETSEAAVNAVTVGPFDVRLKKGATATATGTVLGAQYEAKLTLAS